MIYPLFITVHNPVSGAYRDYFPSLLLLLLNPSFESFKLGNSENGYFGTGRNCLLIYDLYRPLKPIEELLEGVLISQWVLFMGGNLTSLHTSQHEVQHTGAQQYTVIHQTHTVRIFSKTASGMPAVFMPIRTITVWRHYTALVTQWPNRDFDRKETWWEALAPPSASAGHHPVESWASNRAGHRAAHFASSL